jgi:hypothetical protein
MAHPQKYRNEAARLRNEANSHAPDEIQRQLLEIADQYERLAVKLEEMRQTLIGVTWRPKTARDRLGGTRRVMSSSTAQSTQHRSSHCRFAPKDHRHPVVDRRGDDDGEALHRLTARRLLPALPEAGKRDRRAIIHDEAIGPLGLGAAACASWPPWDAITQR